MDNINEFWEKTLATSASLDGVKRLIEQYYCGCKVSLLQEDGAENRWDVLNSRGKIDTVKVLKIGKRYYFKRK
jgi:hypothetical protein